MSTTRLQRNCTQICKLARWPFLGDWVCVELNCTMGLFWGTTCDPVSSAIFPRPQGVSLKNGRESLGTRVSNI